jgi:nucleolar protein 56
VRESIGPDNIIAQAIVSAEELDVLAERLTRKVRDWCLLHVPELAQSVPDHRVFLERLTKESPEVLMRNLRINETAGKILTGEDLQPLLELAVKAQSLYAARDRVYAYVEKVLRAYAPNLTHLAGAPIAAQMIRQAGSLKRLSSMTSGTVQVLGAEKALFRHLTHNTRPPKHGFIAVHPLVQAAPPKMRGKVARALADRLSICAKLDYFKGEFLAPQYEQELKRMRMR